MTLPANIQKAAAVLYRNSASVDAVMAVQENEANRFTHALEDLRRLSLQERIPIAIVGGLGAIYFGYPAVTEDIDIAVAKLDLDRMIETAPQYGFKIAWRDDSGWHTLTHGDVELNVVPEGGKARDTAPTAIPAPTELGVAQGLDYASLDGWLELKISSNRQKDRAHVVEVLKQSSTEAIQAAQLHLEKIHPSYAIIFEQLAEEAADEKKQESNRGRRLP